MELNELIKSRREELGLTLKEVADACEVSESTVSRWESGGIGNMKRQRIAKLAKVLQIPAHVLVGEPQPETVTEDDELLEYLEELRTRPEMKMLFDSSRHMSVDQVKAIVAMIEGFRNGSMQ